MVKKENILTENPFHYPIAFLDYLYVITIYTISAIFFSVIIDGYTIPEFNLQLAIKRSNIALAFQILIQLAVQGFIAIFLYALLQKIESPFNGLYGYTYKTPLGLTVRSPAIISVILFYLATSLHCKLKILFNRFSNKPETNGLPNTSKSNETTDTTETTKKTENPDSNNSTTTMK